MMQDNRRVTLTPKSAERVLDASRSEERFDRLRYNGSGPVHFRSLPRQRVGWPVRVTGPESGGTPDLYPGIVMEFTGYLDGAATWANGEECWVTRLPGATAELADESEHLGEPVGEHEDKVIFAVGAGGTASAYAPVWGRTRLTSPVDLSGSNSAVGCPTLVLTLTVPITGVYMLHATMSAIIRHTVAGAFNTMWIERNNSGLGASVLTRVIPFNCSHTSDGGIDSAHASWSGALFGGEVVTLRGGWFATSGTPSVAKAVGEISSDPLLPASVASTFETSLSYFRLVGDDGDPSTPPPPPPEYGAITGKVLVDDTGASGRTVTLSGATSGTATTDAGVGFAFSPVNAGSHTLTLTLLSGETCTHQVDSGSVTSGNAASVPVSAGVTHTVKFEVTSGGGGPDPEPGGGE